VSRSRRCPTSAGTAERSCSKRSATRRTAERQSRFRVGDRLLLATCSATSARVAREGSGKGLIRAVGERGAFTGLLSIAFGRFREGLERSRDDRGGHGVTFGQTTLLKLECLQGGSSPERVQVIVRRGQLWSGGSSVQGSWCAARKGREILLGDPHEGAQAVGAQRAGLNPAARGARSQCRPRNKASNSGETSS
jgi:hypothetical protein